MTDTSKAHRTWQLERYKAGDEHDLLELFGIVFGTSRSLEHWNWQFANNPYLPPTISLARETASGRLAGGHVVMPFPLNVKGRPVLACHSLDLAVHPDFRRQGIFETTARDCFAWARERGAEAVVAFPNASSYPGFVRSLGWNRILFPRLYAMRLDVGIPLQRVLRSRTLASIPNEIFRSIVHLRLQARANVQRTTSGRRMVVETYTKVPSRYEELWLACSNQEVLSLWKDTKYFQWRYDSNPDHSFQYVGLLQGDELLALAVTVERHRAITICEFVVRGRDPVVGRRLLTELALSSLQGGMRSIDFIGSDGGLFDEVFEGFRRRVAFENVFCGDALSEGHLRALMANPHNWTLVFGDADFV
jgi:GNAT superfamily N-acetyltransferase